MGDAIRVVKSGDYSLISNYHLKDQRLSWGAKGLLSTILAFSGEYTMDELKGLSPDGIYGTDEFSELKQYGYLTWNKQGVEASCPVLEYRIYEKPISRCSLSDSVVEIMDPEDMPGLITETVDEEEKRKLRERLEIDKLIEEYSRNFVELVFIELCRRDTDFRKQMTARAFKKVCATAMEHQLECRNNRIERIPVFYLSVVVNTAFDNIEKGFRKKVPERERT